MLPGGLYSNPFVTLLSGGVGGARLARGFAGVLDADRFAVVVNVGDDDAMYGLHVAADLDTVVYTLAGIEGPQGWGIANDSFAVMDALQRLGVDTRFRLGDRDLAHCLHRTERLAAGDALSSCTAALCHSLGVTTRVLPASDDPVRTRVRTGDAWRSFQEYFVLRAHRDEVTELAFEGADDAEPAPGVLRAIEEADVVVVAPSNPPLSIWPILAVPGIREAVAAKSKVVAVSPLIGGKPLKGPADRVMSGLGLEPSNRGIVDAYEGLVTDLVVDVSDERDTSITDVRVHVADTRIADPGAARRLAGWLLEVVA